MLVMNDLRKIALYVGFLPRGDAKGDSAALASLRASAVSPSGATGVG